MQNTKAGIPEYLSKDILESEFVTTFVVFHRLQYILGSSRVDVKDQFVTVPTGFQKCYTVVCILSTLLFNLAVINMILYIKDATLFYLCVVSLWVYFALLLCVLINSRFCNGQQNADFLIRMQKIDRLMKLDKNKAINAMLKLVNNLTMLLLMCVFIGLIIIESTSMRLDYLLYAGSFYFQLTVIIELTYCSNLVIYFFMRIRFINCIMKNHLSQKKTTNEHSLYIFSNTKFRKIASEAHDFSTSDTCTYLKELFDLFSMFQKLYRFQLFIFCIKLISGSLGVFGVTLITVQSDTINVVDTLTMFVFTLIDIFIALSLAVRLHLFFGEVKEIKRLSIAMMAAYPTGQLREKARKMYKMTEDTPPKLSIYDMFEMDAGIFLTLFSLITSLIVTILQFAIL